MSTNEFEGVTLLDIAELDTSDIAAKHRGEVLPKMFGIFECKSAELVEAKNAETKVIGVRAQYEFEVLGVEKMLDKNFEGREAEYIGKKHFESSLMTNTEGVQYAIGFLEDCGINEKCKLGDRIKMMEGRRISAIISHRKDKNDSEKVYSGLSKIKPVE